MSDYIWSQPVARKCHRCGMCGRAVLSGETYHRMVGFEIGSAWTYKACDHCYRVATNWVRWSGVDEWDTYCIVDWLDDEHGALASALRAGWRYPDGELMPLPFQPRCRDCRCLISGEQLWCRPCDKKRIERISRELQDVIASFKDAS